MIPLYQGGLEIPCNVKVTIADTEIDHVLINAHSELVSKLYCEPEEDMSVRSFFAPESNVNLTPKGRKATEEKTPLSKSVNIKTMFTKSLGHQEANLKLMQRFQFFS